MERIAWGLNNYAYLVDKELDFVGDLERIGVIYCEGLKLRFSDELFRRFILNIRSSRKTQEIYPRYTAEYLVVRRLAYKENLREVLISYTSWGPFDIVILKPPIGIQVKQTTKDVLALSKSELERIISAATEKGLTPILAIFYLHREKILYFRIEEHKITYSIEEGYESLEGCLRKRDQ